MGEARRRGTFDERKQQSIGRGIADRERKWAEAMAMRTITGRAVEDPKGLNLQALPCERRGIRSATILAAALAAVAGFK